jgi:hypothetical protein
MMNNYDELASLLLSSSSSSPPPPHLHELPSRSADKEKHNASTSTSLVLMSPTTTTSTRLAGMPVTLVVRDNDDIQVLAEAMVRREQEETLAAAAATAATAANQHRQNNRKRALEDDATTTTTTTEPAELLTHTHTTLDCERLLPTPLNEAGTRLQSTTLLPVAVYHNVIGFTAGPAPQPVSAAAASTSTRAASELIGQRCAARHALEQRTLEAHQTAQADERDAIDAELLRRRLESGKRARRKPPQHLRHEYTDARSGVHRVFSGGALPALPEAVFTGARGTDAAQLAAYSEQRQFVASLDLSLEQLRSAGFIESRLGASLFAAHESTTAAAALARSRCSFRNCTRAPVSRTLCDTHRKQHWRIVRRFFKTAATARGGGDDDEKK